MQNDKANTGMEDVPKLVETIQEVSQEKGQSGCPECQEEIGRLHLDQHLDTQCFTGPEIPSKPEKVRYRYDQRIGGWKRVY